jgi:hypothetical protein
MDDALCDTGFSISFHSYVILITYIDITSPPLSGCILLFYPYIPVFELLGTLQSSQTGIFHILDMFLVSIPLIRFFHHLCCSSFMSDC